LPELAHEIIEELKWDFRLQYDEKDAIGRRYRRQDAVGTPLCITVDHDSLEDKKVTVRYRDTMEQKRIAITELKEIIQQEVDFKAWMKK
jgi:glycyl-tRNA synthetase